MDDLRGKPPISRNIQIQNAAVFSVEVSWGKVLQVSFGIVILKLEIFDRHPSPYCILRRFVGFVNLRDDWKGVRNDC